MDFLNLPVSALPKIGPTYKKLLENLEIYTVNDLLYHIPFRYDDFSQVKNVSDAQSGETVTVRGMLGEVKNIFTRYGKRLTRAKIEDQTGEVNLIWFNQHYIKNTLLTGETYLASGKISLFDKKPTIISPQLELEKSEGDESLNTGRLVPIYPETSGVSSKWLRSRINDVLTRNTNIIDNLEPLKAKYKLRELNWSLQKIHFPDDLSQITEAKHRLAFDELFYNLLKIEFKKQEWEDKKSGYKFKAFADEVEGFIKTLPFELTDSQITATQEISTDFQKNIPMNRLLEGDVGTGKTIVALISAYTTHLNGFKTIYLAPTEILAQQHFETFQKFLAGTKLNTQLVTGSQKNTSLDFDILVGTHALLYNPDFFTKVGLVVVDEQHRFGVEQRGKLLELSKKAKSPHFLTMTATPIPRTLALTVYGDLDMSTLTTQPKNQRKVVTKIVPETGRTKIYQYILEKNLPTFIVCPFIDQSENAALLEVKAAQKEFTELKSGIFKNVPMGLIHGKMKSDEKQKVISDFRGGKIKILVSTPVIEVGIDIPDATVIIIEGGERYGLASLHQLRGRVGRDTGIGYCFVFISNYSQNAYARLKNLETVSEGLKLAEIDMKNRGQGDIFGTEQHGFKKFKIADLGDFSLIEKAKLAANEVFRDLEKYPEIKNRIGLTSKSTVKNN